MTGNMTCRTVDDRFKLMNLAFDQEDYRVDKNLEVISEFRRTP